MLAVQSEKARNEVQRLAGELGEANRQLREYAVQAEYAAAVVEDSGRPELAAAFVAFLGGDYARSILRRHGFTW